MLYGQVSIDPEIEFLDDFPSVSKEAAVAVLEMAKKTLTTEKVLHENFT
jgi:hypothetical protein